MPSFAEAIAKHVYADRGLEIGADEVFRFRRLEV